MDTAVAGADLAPSSQCQGTVVLASPRVSAWSCDVRAIFFVPLCPVKFEALMKYWKCGEPCRAVQEMGLLGIFPLNGAEGSRVHLFNILSAECFE